ncbi:MAG: hypothetical protein D6721_04455, partial [Gammaproteobacteria bacterium]
MRPACLCPRNATVGFARGVLLFCLLSIVPPALGAHDRSDILADVRRLAEAGAPALALARLEAAMPDRSRDPAEWLRWEKTRVGLLRRLGRTEAVLEADRRWGRSLDPGTGAWLRTQGIYALLEAHRPRAARRLAREALWRMHEADGTVRRRWREAILEAWLAEGRLEEARITLQRLEQDYPAAAAQWSGLHARLLLRLGAAEAAWRRLHAAGRDETPLGLLAALRSGHRTPQAVLARVKALQADDPAPEVRAALGRVRAEALQRLGDRLAALQALEETARNQTARTPEPFRVTGEALWRAYLGAGKRLGNRLQLLQGRDADWYFAATERMEREPLQARALLAVLAETATDLHHRRLAHDYFSRMLVDRDPSGRLLRLLYLDAARFPRPEDIPVPARRRLVAVALDVRDVRLASRLAAGLPAPPGDDAKQAFRWDLLRARVLILGGRVAEGTALLREVLHRRPPDGPQALDRLLQVVFDLQEIGEHARALSLFSEIARLPLDARHRRELWYWIGESRAALGRHREAAVAYLTSAAWQDPHAMDPWAQTARYHAAQELEQAGFLGDAVRVLRGLAGATRDP